VEGPYLDNVGRDMYHGGGKMVVAAGDRKTGAGHFGRTIIDDGIEVTSFHWEADFDQGGSSVLAIRPLLWKNDWPYAGDHFKGGTFEIESERRGYSLELAVDFVRMNVARRGGFGRPQADAAPPKPVENQTLDQVKGTWPEGDIAVRCGDYMFRPHQLWTITPVNEAGGYLSNPYFKITISGTDRALCATANKEVSTVPAFTGADEQLWRIEQAVDGTFRIMPKRIPGETDVNKKLCLYSIADSTPTLAEWDFNTDNSKWNLKELR
jgi:arabinan endo-1,5-alpha-L-arabinosidase